MEDRKSKIIKILDGSSTRLRETYFLNNYVDLFNEIDKHCHFLSDITFKERLWYWVNNINTRIVCICGNNTTFNKNWLDGYKKYCSPKCAQSNNETKERRRNTNIEKYGVDNVAKSNIVKQKTEQTNIDRYGCKSSFQNEDVKNKWKNTIKNKYGKDHIFKTELFKEKKIEKNLEKYGVEHYVQTDEFIEKSINTNLEKYGVDWFQRTKDYQEKTINTNLEKYGESHYSKTKEFIERVKNTNLNRYGAEWFQKTKEFKDLIKSINISKYGVEHFSKSSKYIELVNSDEYKNKRLKQRIEFYKKRGFDFISGDKIGIVKLRNDTCGHEFDIHPTNLQRRMSSNVDVCTICNPINSKQSGQELNIVNWLSEIIDVEVGNRSLINPFELDIYLPSKGIAIEYNGLYWHSELYKDKNYHLNKQKMCLEKSIDLIQIWEDDWLYKQDIVKSIILNRIGIVGNRIGARKCLVKEVTDNNVVNEFFNNNHIQGTTKYKTAIGLYYNEILVSCMLFHKPKKDTELVRFANLINYNITGSASRLFRYYINNYDYECIVSFADRTTFNGNLYKTLGFEFNYRTPVNYWWVVNSIRKHRFNYSKKKLVKMGFDSNKTEVSIMHEQGHYRVFGCGLDKYTWNR